MRLERITLFVLIALLGVSCNQSPSSSTASSSSDPVEEKVDSLLALMTIEEKIGQLNMYNGTWDFTGPVPENDDSQLRMENIKDGKVSAMLNVLTVKGICEAQELAVEESRLGIPMLFGYDIIHGYKTMMPIPLGQASSWDEEVAYLANRVAAKESASAGLSLAFGPMVDITRDARWGRFMEGAGEDPYLSTIMAKGWIHGFQGDDMSDKYSIAACAKHFAGYGFAEAGKEYNTTDMSEQTLMNIVLPPFKAAVDAGVASVMNGFNDLNGLPVTADGRLQRDILKGEWGFDGFVVSDFNSVPELVTHGYSKDMAEAGKTAFLAGSDLEMESRLYEKHLLDQLNNGEVPEDFIDEAVKRVLRIKFRLGLFDNPYKYCDSAIEHTNALTPENLITARDVARRSMVLLKNENNILPLEPEQSVAVIGELAGSKDVVLGNWRAQAVPFSGVSVLEGIQEASNADVSYAEGYKISQGRRSFIFDMEWAEPSKAGFQDALRIAKKSDVVVIVLGEDCYQTGEGRSQVDIGLKGDQLELFKEIKAVNKNVVVVLMNGRPLAIPELAEDASAILETWHSGSEGGNAIADILYGKHNPSGKLPVSFPHHSGQEPLYYNIKNTGRPVTNEFDKGLVFWAHYSDSPVEALYPFGFGLSYSQFEYFDLKLDKQTMKKGGEAVKVTVSLENSSSVDGVEVVQLYIRDLYGSLTRPVKELKNFKRVEVKAGEKITVDFDLTEEDLSYFWPNGRFEAEPGDFHVFVGGNSRDVLQAELVLE